MADSWNPTTPMTWTAGNLDVANLNAEIRDRHESTRAVLTGDGSADSDMWLAVKTGTLAARSSVTHKAGRFYRTTDTHELFISDGTNWRHCGGAGAYDDFTRANSTTITPSASGHVWTEEAGNWDINTNLLRLTGATTAFATLNTGSLLDRPYKITAGVTVNGTQGSIDTAVIVKFVDASNLLYFQLLPTAAQIHSRIAGANTLLSTVAFTPSANGVYLFHIEVYGKTVRVSITTTTAYNLQIGTRHDNVTNAAFAAATKVGFRTPNTAERFSDIAVTF